MSLILNLEKCFKFPMFNRLKRFRKKERLHMGVTVQALSLLKKQNAKQGARQSVHHRLKKK